VFLEGSVEALGQVSKRIGGLTQLLILRFQLLFGFLELLDGLMTLVEIFLRLIDQLASSRRRDANGLSPRGNRGGSKIATSENLPCFYAVVSTWADKSVLAESDVRRQEAEMTAGCYDHGQSTDAGATRGDTW
jgi:hypothetical protein